MEGRNRRRKDERNDEGRRMRQERRDGGREERKLRLGKGGRMEGKEEIRRKAK